MSDYRNELLERYSEPPEPHTKDEWVEMLLHGDQSDSDIMKLVAERDALEKERDEFHHLLNIAVVKLEAAREALNTIYTFGDNFTKVALEGIAVEALQKLEAK